MVKRSARFRQQGLTLLELTVTLLILVMLTSVAVRSTSSLQDQARYQQTKDRLDMIREAILGDPRKTVNGQSVISGFVADMGRLPVSIHELLEPTFCSDRSYATQAACTTGGGTWGSQPAWQQDAASGLWFGWRGPYLQTTQNPNDADAYTDGWGREAQSLADQSYGWALCAWDAVFSPCDYGTKNLSVYSLGSDSVAGGNGYAADFPEALDQATIFQRDYTAALDAGITVHLKGRRFNLDSHCSNAVYTTRSTCTSNGGEWFGGCDDAGYSSNVTCPVGKWKNCSFTSHTVPTDCENAGGMWYGEGYGCANAALTNRTDCLDSAKNPDSAKRVWHACSSTDTGITTRAACEGTSPPSNWFGKGEDSDDRLLCLKLHYRLNGAVATLTASSTPQIVEDGMAHSLLFSFPAGQTVTAGQAAVGIYYQRGTECRSEQPYPQDRPLLPVPFTARSAAPMLDW